jgi:hypothetical protein
MEFAQIQAIWIDLYVMDGFMHEEQYPRAEEPSSGGDKQQPLSRVSI